MRLVIRNRYGSAAGGLHRYNGSGMFSSIGRKLFSSGLKKVINVATKANLPQKIANVVVNGAQSAGQKFGKTVGEKLGKVAGEKVANTLKKTLKRKLTPSDEQHVVAPPPKQAKKETLKRKLTPPEEHQIVAPPSKHAKIDVNHLINGSGIVFD